MTAGPRCCGRPCPFWTRPGPRGCSNGCPGSLRLLPRPPSGPGTGPPGVGGGPWPRGRALLATGWWPGPGHRSAHPGRGATKFPTEFRAAAKGGRVARAWPQGPARPDVGARGPPPGAPPRAPHIAVHRLFQGHADPPVQACCHSRGDGPRRVVGHALAAAADGVRDRRRSPEHRDPCPLDGPGRAAAQAEDRRRVGPGRSCIGSPAAGSIGRTAPVTGYRYNPVPVSSGWAGT